ncbi:outer membrane protein assembly factor BamD [Halomonadaceae bacterium KBTZ08]
MTRRVTPHNAQGTRPHTGARVIGCVLATVLLTGCASTSEDETLPQEKYYEQARSSMNAGNFESAQQNLEALETYYPFGRYAEQAQLDLIYARYQNLDLQGARSAADRFLRLNPQSENADYALYMRGIASYYMDLGLGARYFPIEVEARDPGQQRQAFKDFSQLVNRYPDSDYAADARQRMIAIRNRMAGKELAAAEYYIKREAYIAALNRARTVVEDYSRTPAAEEALMIMAEMYARLGLDQERADTVRVLAQNFPESPALDDNGQFIRQSFGIQDRSLASVLTFGLLGGPKEAR